MTELRRRMIRDMQLSGPASGTQRTYVKAVQRLAGYYRQAPDQLSEQQLRDYFSYLSEQKRVAILGTGQFCGLALSLRRAGASHRLARG